MLSNVVISVTHPRTVTLFGGKKHGLRSSRWVLITNIFVFNCYIINRQQVYIHPHRGVQIPREQVHNFKFTPCTFMGDHGHMPLKWFECQSVLSRRIAIMIIQIQDDHHVNVIWSGDTFAYRGLLGDNNVPGIVHAFQHWVNNCVV